MNKTVKDPLIVFYMNGSAAFKCCEYRNDAGIRMSEYTGKIHEKIIKCRVTAGATPLKPFPHAYLPESAFFTLFLNPHEIFIPRAFVRIHAFARDPLPFPRVEPGRT